MTNRLFLNPFRTNDDRHLGKNMRKLIAISLAFLCVVAALPLMLGHAQNTKRNAPKTVTDTASAISQARKAAERITEEELRAYLPFIAADEMEGRDTPSLGLDLTANVIALKLSLAGVRLGGDNSSNVSTLLI